MPKGNLSTLEYVNFRNNKIPNFKEFVNFKVILYNKYFLVYFKF